MVARHAAGETDQDISWDFEPCENHAAEPTRAPASTVDSAVMAMAMAVPDDAVAIAHALARSARRQRWRSLASRRGARVLACLRRLRHALSFRFAGWSKVDHAWHVLARDDGGIVVAAVVTAPAAHAEADFVDPIRVVLRRPDLLLRR